MIFVVGIHGMTSVDHDDWSDKRHFAIVFFGVPKEPDLSICKRERRLVASGATKGRLMYWPLIPSAVL